MFLRVNRIVSSREQAAHSGRDSYNDSDEDVVNVAGENTGPVEQTEIAIINVVTIRCAYPRKDNKPGTRLTFADGGGFAVTDPFEELVSRLGSEVA
jgi:hypothetical protein